MSSFKRAVARPPRRCLQVAQRKPEMQDKPAVAALEAGGVLLLPGVMRGFGIPGGSVDKGAAKGETSGTQQPSRPMVVTRPLCNTPSCCPAPLRRDAGSHLPPPGAPALFIPELHFGGCLVTGASCSTAHAPRALELRGQVPPARAPLW